MACPHCGSSAYQLVSPGVAQCLGTVLVPTGAHPSGAMGPTHQPAGCGARYQVPNTGGDVPYCECGMQSVAKCVDCEQPLCLDHAARSSDGIVCGEHAAERRAAAQQAQASALQDAERRLRTALSRFPSGLGGIAAELSVEHLLDGPRASGLSEGGPCPVHGAHCRVAHLHTSGKLIKRVTGATMRLDAWVLDHRCYVHSDIHAGGGRSSSNGVELIAVTAAGEIALGTTYQLPLDGKPIRTHVEGLGKDSPRLLDVLQGHANLAGMSLPDYLDDLAEGAEGILAGTGRRGARPCRR